jgi:hypothetical protein
MIIVCRGLQGIDREDRFGVELGSERIPDELIEQKHSRRIFFGERAGKIESADEGGTTSEVSDFNIQQLRWFWMEKRRASGSACAGSALGRSVRRVARGAGSQENTETDQNQPNF